MSVNLEYLRTEFSYLNQLIFSLNPSSKSYESVKGNIDLKINQIQKLISESETSFNAEITQLKTYSQKFLLTLSVIKPNAIANLLEELEIFEVGILNKLAASQESDSKIKREHRSNSSSVTPHSQKNTSSVSTQEKEDTVKAILLRSRLGLKSLPVEKLTEAIVCQRIEDNIAFLRKILPLKKVIEGSDRELVHYKNYFEDSHIPTSVIILEAYRKLRPQEQPFNLVNLRNVLLDFCEFRPDTYQKDLKSICDHHIELASAGKQFSIENLYDEISRVLNEENNPECEERALFREEEDYVNVLFPACSYAYFMLLMRDYPEFKTLESLKYFQELFAGNPEAVVDITKKVNYIDKKIKLRQRLENNIAFLRKILPLPEKFSARPEWLEKVPEGFDRELVHYKEYFGDSHIPTSEIILNAYRGLTPQEQQSNLANLRNVLLGFCKFMKDTYRLDLKCICNHHIKLASAREQFSIENLYYEISKVLNNDSGVFKIRPLFRDDDDENELFSTCSYAYFMLLMHDYTHFRTLESLKDFQALFKRDPKTVVEMTKKVDYVDRMINMIEHTRTSLLATPLIATPLIRSSEHKG